MTYAFAIYILLTLQLQKINVKALEIDISV